MKFDKVIKRAITAPKASSDDHNDLFAAIRNSGMGSLKKIPKESIKKEGSTFKTLAELKKVPSKTDSNDKRAKPMDIAEDLKFALKSFRKKVSGDSNPEVDKDDGEWSNSGSINNSLAKMDGYVKPNSCMTTSVPSLIEYNSHLEPHNISQIKSNLNPSLTNKQHLTVSKSRKKDSTSSNVENYPNNTLTNAFSANANSSISTCDMEQSDSQIKNISNVNSSGNGDGFNPFADKSEAADRLNPFSRKKSATNSNRSEGIPSYERKSQANTDNMTESGLIIKPNESSIKSDNQLHVVSAKTYFKTADSKLQNDDSPFQISPPTDQIQGNESVSAENCNEPLSVVSYEVEALYEFSGARSDDLVFKLGDIMAVLNESGDWLYGSLLRTNISGWFPKSYTRVRNPNSEIHGNF